MATFHLHARLLEGGLLAPTRDEVQSHEDEDRERIEALAERLAARGFAVWVYEHDQSRSPGPDGQHPFRVVAEWTGDGRRIR